MSAVLEQVIGGALKLSIKGDRLRVRGPQRLLDHSTLMEEIRKHKSDILAELKGDLSQEWLFEILRVGEDPWLIGIRLDKPDCWMWWFVGSEVSKQ